MASGYGYVRGWVNPGQKGVKGASSQEADIRAFAAAKKVQLKQIFREPAGLVPELVKSRAVGRKLLNALKEGDTLIVATFDRLFLNAGDAEQVVGEFLKRRIQLFAVDIGVNVAIPAAVLLLHAIKAAELERQSLRIKVGTKKKRDSKSFPGGKPPFGYKKEGDRIIEHSKQQQAMRQAVAWRKKKISYRNIARLLNRKAEISVSHVTVRRLLRDLDPDT